MMIKHSLSSTLALAIFLSAPSYAANPFSTFFKKIKNSVSDCNWDYKKEEDLVRIRQEMLNTPQPEIVDMIHFQESDFETKPFLKEFKYVIVVNNESPYLHSHEMLSKDVVNSVSTEMMTPEAHEFFNKVKIFGVPIYRDGKYLLSRAPGAQTMRIYENGKLIRVAPVSTGRGIFELKAKTPQCSFRPAQSYYSYTEPGYFTFQELVKNYESSDYDADMPNAMFYIRNRGIALHEVFKKEKIAALGVRASGGCTRLDPNTAETLFESVKATAGAAIPVIDRSGNPTFDGNGDLVRKTKEEIIFKDGKKMIRPTYSALLIVQPVEVKGQDRELERSVNYRYTEDTGVK